ncbi:MAG: DUF1552 domain-containing protein [Sandaracinaceae bacterium]
MKKYVNRRGFLTMSAAAAGGLMLGARPPRAEAQGTPPRFLLIYGGGGWTPRATFMRPGFSDPSWGHWSDILKIARGNGMPNTTPETSEFEFSFTDPALVRSDMSRVLDVFWDNRSKMLAFEGLAMLSTGWDGNGDAHAQNHLATATGGPSAYEYDGVKSHAAYRSLDQVVLDHLKTTDPLAYSFDLNPNVGRNSGTSGFHYFLYSDNGAGGVDRLPTEGNPSTVFARYFGGIEEMTADTERRQMAERAVFQRLQRQYADLASKMSGFDKMRLETHRDLLNELDRQLAAPPIACSAPDVPDVSGLDRAAAYESDWNAFADMVAAGFGCGITRVASLSLNSIPPEAYGLAADTDIHHDYEHNSDPRDYYGPEGDAGGNVAAEEGMIQRQLFQARLVNRLITRLDQLPEMDGSVLDNTIVLYVSELANGNHGAEYCPFLVFGGSNTSTLRQGRYLKYRQDNPNPWNRNYSNEHTGTPHSQLYVSLLRGMGLDIDYIHAPSIDGRVPHLNIDGTIDMSGPLPRLA